jgi:hypothetical protein
MESPAKLQLQFHRLMLRRSLLGSFQPCPLHRHIAHYPPRRATKNASGSGDWLPTLKVGVLKLAKGTFKALTLVPRRSN